MRLNRKTTKERFLLISYKIRRINTTSEPFRNKKLQKLSWSFLCFTKCQPLYDEIVSRKEILAQESAIIFVVPYWMRRLLWMGRERLVIPTALCAWTIWMSVITYLRLSDRISAEVFLIWVSTPTSSVAGLLIGIFLRRRIATPAAFRRAVVAVFTGIFGSILMIVFGFVYVTIVHTVGFRRGTLLDFALLNVLLPSGVRCGILSCKNLR